MGVVAKSFGNVFKSRLNSVPLSNTTICGILYLYIHVWFNSCLTLYDYLFMYAVLPLIAY